MWSLSAQDETSLEEISGAVHDAYVDGSVEHDRAAGVVVIPILQEGWPEGPPGECVPTHDTWRYREYRVTLFRGRLIVRRVQAVHESDDWTYAPMIEDVGFDAQAHEVRVQSSSGCLRLTVAALDAEVELSHEPGGHVRRRVGRLTGIESESWVDQHR
jgi:hypothetical protein